MKLHTLIFSAIMGCGLVASAQTPWIHVYLSSYETKDGLVQFPSMPVADLDTFYLTKTSTGRLSRMIFSGKGVRHETQITNIDHWTIGRNVPTFRINTDPAVVNPDTFPEITSKVEYVPATVEIDGAGIVDDFTGNINIRGRGNYTWNNVPKKSYRMKFAEKTKICGYKKAKNFLLLANYIDPSFMRNPSAYIAADLAGMPYPNHTMPVDVYFNDLYKGSYMLTEKCGFNNGSVDLKKEEEANSIMFEIDTNFDEDLRTVTPYFRLPLMLKDPDAPADSLEAKAWWNEWVADFEEMEHAVYQGKNIGDYIDYNSLAKYLLVFNIACNQEINHPKSVYLYKTKGGKYQFGPAWDFDWAFGFRPSYRQTTGEGYSASERRALLDAARAEAEKNLIGKEFAIFTFNGITLWWVGGDNFYWVNENGATNYGWPDTYTKFEPSYSNYLLGVGQNSNNPDGMGNGGEFFSAIVKNNPEFMDEYQRVWEEFQAHIPEFFDTFDAYAADLAPTAERNLILHKTKWDIGYVQPENPADEEFAKAADNNAGAVKVLRQWISKRFDFIAKPENNFGLFPSDKK